MLYRCRYNVKNQSVQVGYFSKMVCARDVCTICVDVVVLVVHLVMTVCSANLSILFGSSSEPTLSVGRFNGFTVRTDPEFDEEMKLWTPTQDNVVNFGKEIVRVVKCLV